jgi:hypothetical protein
MDMTTVVVSVFSGYFVGVFSNSVSSVMQFRVSCSMVSMLAFIVM